MSAFETIQFTDQVFTLPLPATIGADAEPAEPSELRIAASSLLMEGFSSGRVLEGRSVNDVIAVQDELGRAILFSLSTERRLMAVVSAQRDRDDREEYDLTAGLSADAVVVAFGAGQSNQGDIYLAIAVATGSRVELRITRKLSNRVGAVPWGDFGGQWVARGGREGGTVTRVLLGNEPVRRDAAPLIILVTREGGDARYYEGDSDFETAPRPWKPLSLPENAGDVTDIVVGRNRRGDGVYVLLEKAGARRLFFVPQNPQAPTPELPIPAGLAKRGALGVLASGPRGETDLFQVGDGAYVLPWNLQLTGARPEDLVTLAGPEVASGLRNVLVCDDEQAISVWAIDGNDQLLFVPGTRTVARTTLPLPAGDEVEALAETQGEDAAVLGAEPVKWAPAIPGFRRDVRMIAPLRNRMRQANSLITLGKSSDVRQLLETSHATIWDDKPIPVRDDTGTQAFQCYATNLNVTDANGNAFTKPPTLQITASERTEVLIDGVLHDIDEQTPVTVKPDLTGVVTIMNRVRGTASPILRIAGPAGGKAAVDPAAKVRASLARVDGPQALRDAKLPDGTPVFPNVDDKTLADAAQGFKKLNEMAGKLPADGGRSQSYLNEKDASEGNPAWFGMAFDGEAVRFYDSAMGDSKFALMGDANDDWITRALRAVAGPVIEAMRNIGNKLWAFVVEQAGRVWEFAVKLGDRAYRFAVECLAQVQNIVDWLLQNVLRAPFDALAKWLGFVFSWEDIVVTHDVLTNVANQVLGKLADSAGGFAGKVDGFFTTLITEVKKLKPLDDARANGGMRSSDTRMREDLSGGLRPEDRRRFSGANGFESSPAGTFASFHCKHSLRMGGGAALLMTAEELGPLEVIQSTMTDLWTKVGGSIEALIKDLADTFQSGKLTINELLQRIAARTTVDVLEMIRAAVVGLGRIVESLVRLVREKLNQPLSVPFLSYLYKRAVGREMTAMSGFMLLLSIPATSLHKVLTGEAPFPFETVSQVDGAPADEAFGAKKPKTYGLDTLVGSVFWAALAAGGGLVGGAFFALYKISAIFKQFADSAYKTLEGAYQAIGPLIGLGMALLKTVVFIANGVWIGMAPPRGWNVPADFIIPGRWINSLLPVLAAWLAVLEPTNTTSAIVRILSAIVDMLIALIWCGIRIYNHITGSVAWLVAVDVAEVFTSGLANLATLLGGAGTLSPEGTSKGVLIGLGYVATALWVPAAALTTAIVPYIPMSEVVFPIA